MQKLLLLLLFVATILSQGQFSGVTYFNYSYNLTENAENNKGFGLKRVYFTYEQRLSENLSYKFQTDVGQLDVIEIPTSSGWDNDTKTQKTQYVTYLKIAKVDWKSPLGQLIIGLQGMNIFNITEKTWGLRFLEKSPMDKYEFSSSADMGIGYIGKFNNLNYSIMFTNGSGYKSSENDKYKKISTQFVYGEKKLVKRDGFNVGSSFSIEPYDYEDDNNIISTKNKTLIAFYGGYAANDFRIGAEFDIHRDDGTDITKQIIAGYMNYKLSDKINILGRLDIFDPWTESTDDLNTNNINEEKDSETNIIAGFNYIPTKGLTITPNIRISIPEDGYNTTLFMLNFEFKF